MRNNKKKKKKKAVYKTNLLADKITGLKTPQFSTSSEIEKAKTKKNGKEKEQNLCDKEK